MKKIIVILTLVLMLSSCGENDANSNKEPINNTSSGDKASKTSTSNKSTTDKILACSYLTKDFIQANFSGAKISYHQEADIKYSSHCTAIFNYNGARHKVSLTINTLGKGETKFLDNAVANFSEGLVKEISGIGDKAYLRSDAQGFIMALKNKNIIQVSVAKGDRDKFNFELTKPIINALFKEIEK